MSTRERRTGETHQYESNGAFRQLEGRNATVVLGGGGARGLAHLGALQAIAESGIHIERIVGVSIGALAGAMCGTYSNILSIQNEVVSLLNSTSFRRHQASFLRAARAERGRAANGSTARNRSPWYRRVKRIVSVRRNILTAARASSALPASVLRGLVNELVPDLQLEDSRIPLSVVAVDLLSGNRIVIESGSLQEAVQASASIPGVFPAVRKAGMLLCDVGVIDSLPISVAKAHKPDFTLAVDVGQPERSLTRCESALDTILRIQSIAEQKLRRYSLGLADLHLRPDVKNEWFDFSNPEEVIEASYLAVSDQLTEYARSPLHRIRDDSLAHIGAPHADGSRASITG